MPLAATNLPLQRWASRRIVTGVTDRHLDRAQILGRLRLPYGTVEAEQVHGGSLAGVERRPGAALFVPGCDALLTRTPGLALLIRTADCLPICFADPARAVIGIAHAGWRGLTALLLQRVVAAFRHLYQSRADALHVAIGPAIRSCCYEVGPEFRARFGPFVQERAGRRTCDLVGVAIDQLEAVGVRRNRIVDSGRCTACETQRWFSVRREGSDTGRMTSCIMLR